VKMEFNNPFQAEGNWYKGNLHMHTNNSDGTLCPKEMVAEYKKAGYHFLAITDHFKLTSVKGLSDKEILVFTGEETNPVGVSDVGWDFEFVAFNIKEEISFPQIKNPEVHPQEVIDLVLAQGGEVYLAHPNFASLSIKDTLSLKGLLGIEIFNPISGLGGRSYSVVHWDDLLTRGIKTFGFAADDSHSGVCLNAGYIMVKATALSKKAITESIRKGLFYSTNGPRILNLTIEDNQVSVFTPKVKCINFVGNIPFFGGCQAQSRAGKGSSVNRATYRLKGGEKYIRVECTDEEGKSAWTNPIFFS